MIGQGKEFTMIEGVDYSTESPGAAALKVAGKHFVVRYLAQDSRGLTAVEIQDLGSGGIDLALIYESTETRWQGGEEAGIADADYAQRILASLGLPLTTPIYFAVDDDATPEDQTAIDAYLRGAGTQIMPSRVGVYGGYWIVSRCAANGSAAWFWQTTAWSGGQLFVGAHLYQYGYNLWIGETNCDAVRALQVSYGQASKLSGRPIPAPPPLPEPKPISHPNVITGITLPDGLTVNMLKRMFTGNAQNRVKVGAGYVSFSPNGSVSRTWTKKHLAAIPKGKTWRDINWAQIKDAVLRGKDGADGTDYLFFDGSIIHADVHGHVTA